MADKLEDQIRKARFQLSKQMPYISRALFAMQLVESDKIPFPMGVDQFYRLYYNPKLNAQFTYEEIKAIVYHEVCHLIRMHHSRLGSRNKELFNICTDIK